MYIVYMHTIITKGAFGFTSPSPILVTNAYSIATAVPAHVRTDCITDVKLKRNVYDSINTGKNIHLHGCKHANRALVAT